MVAREFSLPSDNYQAIDRYPAREIANPATEQYSLQYEQKYTRPSENYREEYSNNASLPNYLQEPVKAVTREQDEYADNLFNNLLKNPDASGNKKKQYAEDLKRQMEEKNRRRIPEPVELGLNIGNPRTRNEDKNQYAADLEAQIRAKKQGISEEYYPFPSSSASQTSDKEKKQRYAQELEAQIRNKKQVGRPNMETEEYYPFPSNQDSSKDKKLQYAQDLQAQIREKNSRNSVNPEQFSNPASNRNIGNPDQFLNGAFNRNIGNPDQFVNPSLGRNIENPDQYANPPVGRNMRNPEQYSNPLIGRNIGNPDQFSNPPLGRNAGIPDSFSNPAKLIADSQRPDLYNDYYAKPPLADYRSPEENSRIREPAYRPVGVNYHPSGESEAISPKTGRRQVLEEPLIQGSLSNPVDGDKKLRYRQELERQIEEQKRRKDEEKKKLKMDEEKAEKRYFNDAGIDPTKPIIRQKTVDPNKPSEENPQAERYKEHLQRAKGSRPDLSKEAPDDRLSQNPMSTKSDMKKHLFEPQAPESAQSRDIYSEQRSKPHSDYQNPYASDPRKNSPDFPNMLSDQRHHSVPPENQYPLDSRGKMNSPDFPSSYPDPYSKNSERSELRKNETPHNSSLIETYLREIQETRLERDMAREKCLEMRELMLKEKERNLENLLNLARNNSYESRPNSYQEPRYPGGTLDSKSQVYPGYRPSPVPEGTGNAYPEYSTNLYGDNPIYTDPQRTPSYQYAPPQSNWRKNPEIRPYGYQEDLIDINPQVPPVPSGPIQGDLFERSLAGSSKWVDVNHSKWGNVKIVDSVQVPKDLPQDDPKERRKWGVENPPYSHQEELEEKEEEEQKLTEGNTPRFQLHTKSNLFKNLYADDESLPSKIEHVAFVTTQADLAGSHEGSIEEEIEYNSDQIYSDHEPSDREVEQTREIMMSNPKYEEVEEHLVDSDNWSDSHSEAEAEVKNKPSSKGSYNRPQIIDIFREKAANRVDPSPRNKVKQESPREAPKPSAAQGRVAFSRLEEARKHAKELKARETLEESEVDVDVDVEMSKGLESQRVGNKSHAESSFEGRFTKLALNELRQQKIKNSLEDSCKSFSNLNSSSSNKKAMRNFENIEEVKHESILKSLPGVRSQSRRYED